MPKELSGLLMWFWAHCHSGLHVFLRKICEDYPCDVLHTKGSEEPINVSAHIECKDFLSYAYNYTAVGKEAHYPMVKRHLPLSQEHQKAGGRELGYLVWRPWFHEHT